MPHFTVISPCHGDDGDPVSRHLRALAPALAGDASAGRNAVALLRSESVGEKPPQAKLGARPCWASGSCWARAYYLAVSIKQAAGRR
ncbi:MAG: hypothetical protein ACLU3I_05330 [Acutalibacteraceae bacterium]